MSPVRIFLVEDSSIIRDNLVDALSETAAIEIAGCADNEASAVAWLDQGRDGCDLIIIDIFLKSGNGLGVLKALSASANPKRLVLSNHATPEIRAMCLELGATEVFDKSNQIDELLGWLRRFARSDHGAAASHS